MVQETKRELLTNKIQRKQTWIHSEKKKPIETQHRKTELQQSTTIICTYLNIEKQKKYHTEEQEQERKEKEQKHFTNTEFAFASY